MNARCLSTMTFAFQGDELHINANAAGGEIRVALETEQGEPIEGFTFEDCVPLRGDETDLVMKWKSDEANEGLPQRAVRIVLELKNTQLYSLWCE